MRIFNISLTVLFFVLLGFITALLGSITFKALGIPTKNAHFQNNLKELNSNNFLTESADISEHNYEERAMDKNLSKELFLYSRPDDKDKLNQKMNVDSQNESRKIYTIQIGSHMKKADAEEEFNSIRQSYNKKDLNFLRIEKVGKYYTIRLGKFRDYTAAEKFLKAIQPRLSKPIILNAYIKDKRIIGIYTVADKTGSFFKIGRFVIARRIENMEPAGIVNALSSSTNKVYCFLEARDIIKNTNISFVWYFGENEVTKVDLSLRQGKRWRTYSSKKLAGSRGDWKVELQDARGTVIDTVKFTVE